MAITIVGLDGQIHDLAWAQAKYGTNVLSEVDIPTGDCYRVTAAREITGNLATTCTVVGPNGQPMGNIVVNYCYPEPVMVRKAEVTNGAGTAEHSMGDQEQYDPRNAMGPISWQVRDYPSARVRGLGWLSYTNHTHLDITVTWTTGDGPEPPDGCLPKFMRKIVGALGLDL